MTTTKFPLAPDQVSLSAFLAGANAVAILCMGRQWEIFFEGNSLGFADGTEQDALVEAHRRAVNNALYANGPDGVPALTRPLPSAEALASHPELAEKFPEAVAKMPTTKTQAQTALEVLPEHLQQILHVFRNNTEPNGCPETTKWYYLDGAKGWNYLTLDGYHELLKHVPETPEAIRAVFMGWQQWYGRGGWGDAHCWKFLVNEVRLPHDLLFE